MAFGYIVIPVSACLMNCACFWSVLGSFIISTFRGKGSWSSLLAVWAGCGCSFSFDLPLGIGDKLRSVIVALLKLLGYFVLFFE